MAIITITPPAVEPVALEDFKSHLGITDDTDDAMIQSKLAAARQSVEQYLGFPLVTTVFEMVLDAFPRGAIQFPAGVLQSVASVKYIAPTGVETTLTVDDDYRVDTASNPGWISPVNGWPSTQDTINAVRIRYSAGYGDADAVPSIIKEAIAQVGAGFFENRESVFVGGGGSVVPMGAAWILDQHRSYAFE